jgi:hypothetical protein
VRGSLTADGRGWSGPFGVRDYRLAGPPDGEGLAVAVPQPRRLVIGGGQDAAAVGREHRAVNRAGVALEGGELQYRGRLDASRTTPVPDARRYLYEAMKAIAETGRGPAEQMASMGCSIKWKH